MFYTYTSSRPGKFAATQRGVRFNLSDQDTFVQGFATPIAPDTVWPAYVLVRCSQVNIDMLAMRVTDPPANCPGSFRFWQTQTGKMVPTRLQSGELPHR